MKTGVGEEYAQCLRMLGANRLEARCGCVGAARALFFFFCAFGRPRPTRPRRSPFLPPFRPSFSPCAISDGFVRQIVIPGSLRKKEWVGVGDILLVSLRIGMTDDKVGDLMAKLYPEEIQLLKQKGDISEAWQAGGAGEGEGDSGFVFSDGVEEEEDDDEEVNMDDL